MLVWAKNKTQEWLRSSRFISLDELSCVFDSKMLIILPL